jgi:hypothetical protein
MQNWSMSHLEWITSEALMNNGGACSMNGSTSSKMIPPTSLGMRSRYLSQVATKNWDRSEPELDIGDTSKMKAEEPSTSCAMENDQACAERFSIEMRILNLSGEKRAPAW